MGLELRPGDLFADRFEIRSRLDGGGYGKVYRGFDTFSKTDVAIKILDVGSWASPYERWRESAMLKLVGVEGVARMLDQGISRNRSYLATQFVDGTYFPSRVQRSSWTRLEPLAKSLLETLARVHARGVVHADLKPSNILVTDDTVTLVDFGIAHRAFEGDESRETAGSPTYMSLDLFAGESPTPKSDLYAVGVMLYEALTGDTMFDTRSIMEWFGRLREHGPPSIAGKVEGLPSEAEHLIDSLRGITDTEIESATEALALIDPSIKALDWRRELARDKPWTTCDLEELFHGPEIGWRIRSRAAHELFARTAGEPEEVLAELEGWVAAGFAHFELGRFRVGLRGLALIETGRILRPPAELELSTEEDELLAFIKFTQPVTFTELEQLFGPDTKQVLEGVEQFVVTVDSKLRLNKNVVTKRTEHHVRAARAFLEQQSEPSKLRVDLALVCEDAETIVDETVALTDDLEARGRGIESLPILKNAVQFVDLIGAEMERRQLLKRWARAALWTVAEEHKEDVVFAHRDLKPPYLEMLELTTRARTDGIEAFDALGALAAFEEPDFELARHIYRSFAARQLGVEYQKAAYEGIREFAEKVQTESAWGFVKLLEGYVAYDEFDFERAAHLFLEAYELADYPRYRLSRLFTAGSMFHFGLNYERALELFDDALELAEELQEPELFLRIYAARREVLSAMGHQLEAEHEYVEAIELAMGPWKVAIAYLVEAAIAWRSGDDLLARENVLQAAAFWEKTHFLAGRVLCRSFELFLRDERPGREEIDKLYELRDEIRAPRLRAQSLLFLSRCIEAPERDEWVEDALARVPEDQRSTPLELIALDQYDSLVPRFERQS